MKKAKKKKRTVREAITRKVNLTNKKAFKCEEKIDIEFKKIDVTLQIHFEDEMELAIFKDALLITRNKLARDVSVYSLQALDRVINKVDEGLKL